MDGWGWVSYLGMDPDGWGVALLQGAGVTLEISLGAFVVGIALGLLGAAAKLSGVRVLERIAQGYTTLCRAVPELLLILLLYYAGTDAINLVMTAIGIGPVAVNGFAAAVIVLGIVQGAYAAEIIRGAILAIPFGQIEAGRAFGASPGLVFRRVTLPAMAPYALAGFANLWLILVKDSALISVVGYNELLYTAKQAAGSTREYMRYYLMVAIVYFAITSLSGMLFREIERRFGRWMPAS
ncbi:ABC transporter permease subunit [Burkholderia pseudomultivorans]|uniref:ABC transporter permease n=1 Tax=Burkholderia pseudomultivorans TaxID=1207504 RepID=UPI002874C38D|nr:ABC transporter permease subunit [Burkholderia pseudomultivorans]MDS0858903.1 ABC transporter permease subunit [Burkholderia pseudomultivorans]